MDPALENLGWTQQQWDLICTTVTEEAQKGRVAAQALPLSGPEDPTTEVIPNFTLDTQLNPTLFAPPAGEPPPAPAPGEPTAAGVFLPPLQRLRVNSEPLLHLSTIAINVQLRGPEFADPALKAALVAFRRAANYIARVEDALVFNGRNAPDGNPLTGSAAIPPVYRITGGGTVAGILSAGDRKEIIPVKRGGEGIVNAVSNAISALDAAGQLGPYACVLGHKLFEQAVNPTESLVQPRDRILPFLGGPLLRASTIEPEWGAVIALSGDPVEIVVATDIGVQFLLITPEPRYVFRVSERVAVRIKEDSAIALLHLTPDANAKAAK